jgi:hypothetical protein
VSWTILRVAPQQGLLGDAFGCGLNMRKCSASARGQTVAGGTKYSRENLNIFYAVSEYS